MRPPSPSPRRSIATFLLAGLVLAAVAPAGVRSEPSPSPAPTVPVPPPEPPPRPDDLRTLFPAGEKPASPILDAPAPPERPPELSTTPATPRQTSPEAPTTRPPEAATERTPAQSAPLSAPLPAPSPPPRPDELRTQFPAGEKPPSPILDAPPPPERPADLSAVPAQDAPLPPGRPPELSGESALRLTVGAPEDTECLRRLGELGVTFAKQEPIVNGQCSVAHPLTVSVLGGGIVLRPGETMVCRVAEALAKWSSEVQRIAEAELGDSLKGVNSAGAYVCRGQNHDTEAPLSDHAFANAVDIAGFTFARRAPITVGTLPEGTKEAAFLAAVRAKACGFFTTVLGPGTDEAHATHLHFDARERRNGYRLCQ